MISRPGCPVLAAFGLSLLLAATPALPQSGPLSANDWLRSGGAAPANSSAWRPGDPVPPDAARLRKPVRRPATPEAVPDIADSAAAIPVGVRRLGAADPDGAGIISARQAGLPERFWDGTEMDTALGLIRADPALPAAAQVARRIIEAQLPPPARSNAAQTGTFFAARVDQLIAQGALPSARDLLQGAGQDNPETFRRLFDLSLLLGGEDRVCARMERAPGISDDPAARIFCLAQSGDWPAAATLFLGASRLGMVAPETEVLLRHYLDDASVDGAETLPLPDPMTPLSFRLHEAIGQPLPTGNLGLSYAWADLDDRSGWKAQLEAGERLARAGVLPASTLHRLYAAQKPAASGGVWERAAAVQALEAALPTGDASRIGAALVTAFQRMEAAGLRDAFAAMTATRLDPALLGGEAARLALWLRLWNGQTEATAAPQNELDAALLALATGGQPAPLSPALGAFAPVFAGDLPDAPDPNGDSALAPALYGALADADAGLQGDVTRAARGIQMLRELGLLADARRIATQIALDPLLRGAAQ
ncbi:hypothetical protein SAMN05421538_105108 [Paracoccus isoporae]|uniref:Antifreeze glycopeptide polyprotein n=1 Tax=Paracoccus isoporae TaxID=591205 RepID=A0A1G7BIA2_9RHOB|nr:hypothetical protein [Paracoccus isoporae]SDE26848.1 hypothetical protein SAMN05421538_105108 [Paracoccus isoporae]